MSLALNPSTRLVYFDNWEPGKRNYSEAKAAEADYKRATGKKISAKTQRHHINWNRADGRKHNIAIAEDQKEHDGWHRQMIRYIVDSVNAGLLKFDFRKRKYYSSHPVVAQEIQFSRDQELKRLKWDKTVKTNLKVVPLNG